MKKRLLILSYYFPPDSIIGAARPYRIADFFFAKGWEVSVLACSDDSVTKDPFYGVGHLDVVRVQVPSLLRWINSQPKGDESRSLKGKVYRAVRILLRNVLWPEPFALVCRSLKSKGDEMLSRNRYHLILSTALPFSMHCTARKLSMKHGIPWVADNRDLWATSPYRRLLIPRRYFDCAYERAVLDDAVLVVGVSKAMVGYYVNVCGLRSSISVMNGYGGGGGDDRQSKPLALCQTASCEGILDIVYAGGLYGGLRNPEPLFIAVSQDQGLRGRVKVSFYGSEEDCVNQWKRQYPDCRIEVFPRVSKSDLQDVYERASILLVVLGEKGFEKGVLTGKFFEYLPYGKPIIAIAPDSSELGAVVNGYGLGLAARDPVRIGRYLHDVIDENVPLSVDPPRELSSDYQTGLLYERICDILGKK
ncbi:MAG: hypothetical protein KUL86_11575 [Castellaniella sp.]|nr:hypothetical protein [Castellaniella sp.]